MYVCMYVCMYARTYVCTYVCMYARTYVCTYVCVCMQLPVRWLCFAHFVWDTHIDTLIWCMLSVHRYIHQHFHVLFWILQLRTQSLPELVMSLAVITLSCNNRSTRNTNAGARISQFPYRHSPTRSQSSRNDPRPVQTESVNIQAVVQGLLSCFYAHAHTYTHARPH